MWDSFRGALEHAFSGDGTDRWPEMHSFDESTGADSRFDRYYHCYSASVAGKPELEKGNKILLPPTALQALARLNVSWPMLFELSNAGRNRKTHCGVLEFVADEGVCNLPYWMMQNLCLQEGDFIRVLNTSLPKGTFVKLQPVTSDFLEISNPKAVLENSLRHFAALTVGDRIALNYNDRTYEIEIVETRPSPAISVIETDVDVGFAPPKDYIEKVPSKSEALQETSSIEPSTTMPHSVAPVSELAAFTVFGGSGNRLDGNTSEVIAPTLNKKQKSLEEEPWKASIIHGVRAKNQRYTELLAKGMVKPWATPGVQMSREVFAGRGYRLNES